MECPIRETYKSYLIALQGDELHNIALLQTARVTLFESTIVMYEQLYVNESEQSTLWRRL